MAGLPSLAARAIAKRDGNRAQQRGQGLDLGHHVAQCRAELFNVFNRANFASPDDNQVVFDPKGNPISSAGLIVATQTPSRQIQFALKLIWE